VSRCAFKLGGRPKLAHHGRKPKDFMTRVPAAQTLGIPHCSFDLCGEISRIAIGYFIKTVAGEGRNAEVPASPSQPAQ